MPRPRDEAAQIASLSESLRRSATISVALTILTVLTIIGVSVYLYRRSRHPKTRYAPLNSSIELLPITSDHASTTPTPISRQGKRRVAAFARKARRVFAKGKLAQLSGRKWGRKNKKVVHWELPEDDHQELEYTDDDDKGTSSVHSPQVSRAHFATHEASGSRNPRSLIDVSVVGEDDIGDPSQHPTSLLVDLEEARRPPWLGTAALTPSSSTSSNPTPYPSQDLVDLSTTDETNGPFTRPKPSLRSFTLLVPSSPLELASPSPSRTFHPMTTLDRGANQVLGTDNVWANVHLTPSSPTVAAPFPNGKVYTPNQKDLHRTREADILREAFPSHDIPEPPEVTPLVDDKSDCLLHALSSPIHGSQPVSPVDEHLDKESCAEAEVSEGPLSAETAAPRSPVSPQAILVDEERPPSRTSIAVLSDSPSATTLKELDELELSCYPFFDDLAIPSPAPSARKKPLPRVSTGHVLVEQSKSLPTSPRSFTLPDSPELRSKLLNLEHTAPVMLDDESSQILKLEEFEVAADLDNPSSLSTAPVYESLSPPHSHDDLDDLDDIYENAEDTLSISSDPELPSFSDVQDGYSDANAEFESPYAQHVGEVGLPAASYDEVPHISVSIPVATECGAEDPELPSITYSPPMIQLVTPIQTPTPPPSPPSQLSVLPSSPHPRLFALQNRDNGSDASMLTSPQLRPSWSLRASDAPVLGLAPPKAQKISPAPTPVALPMVEATQSLPGSFEEEVKESETTSVVARSPAVNAVGATKTAEMVTYRPPRLRNLRSPVDIALAMQLRPGLGLGADPAWMVRFLMAMFGWLAVLVGSNGDF